MSQTRTNTTVTPIELAMIKWSSIPLALKRRIPGAVLFAWAFFLPPLVYYFVTVHARFRHPLRPNGSKVRTFGPAFCSAG
jgi:hypothetical protein